MMRGFMQTIEDGKRLVVNLCRPSSGKHGRQAIDRLVASTEEIVLLAAYGEIERGFVPPFGDKGRVKTAQIRIGNELDKRMHKARQ